MTVASIIAQNNCLGKCLVLEYRFHRFRIAPFESGFCSQAHAIAANCCDCHNAVILAINGASILAREIAANFEPVFFQAEDGIRDLTVVVLAPKERHIPKSMADPQHCTRNSLSLTLRENPV